MRSCKYTLTAAAVQRQASHCLERHLRLADHGPKCTVATLVGVLLWAAARVASLAAACAALRQAPSDQAVRDALLATLPELAELRRRLNRALAEGLPRRLLRRAQKVAMDLHLIPYYGQPQQDARELYRGARKAGTKTFHAYATAYVICRGCRYTLALRPVHHADPWDEVVGDLLRQVRRLGVRVDWLLLDRGFFSVGVIRYLQAARCPFLMPVIQRGRKASAEKGAGGTRAFGTWRHSGWATYTLQERRGRRRRATVTIAVCHRRVLSRRRKKTVTWVYALWGRRPASLAWVRETYRLRFGIESSYRQLNQARIRTTSRSPLLRLLFVGLALVLRNVWVWLHWEVLAQRRRGHRRIDLDQLPFRAMLHWLQEVAETLLGQRTERTTQRPMPTAH
jgi:Transposase DDE domain